MSDLINLKCNKVIRIRFLTFSRQIVQKNGFKIWSVTLKNYKYDNLFLSNTYWISFYSTFTNGFDQKKTSSYAFNLIHLNEIFLIWLHLTEAKHTYILFVNAIFIFLLYFKSTYSTTYSKYSYWGWSEWS